MNKITAGEIIMVLIYFNIIDLNRARDRNSFYIKNRPIVQIHTQQPIVDS